MNEGAGGDGRCKRDSYFLTIDRREPNRIIVKRVKYLRLNIYDHYRGLRQIFIVTREYIYIFAISRAKN